MEDKAFVLDEVLDEVRRALERCDAADVGQVAAIHLDFAVHLLTRERAEERAGVWA